jgi:hypothetical protein
MHNAADDPTVVRALNASHIGRQMRFDPLPLFIAEPKQVLAHIPIPQSESDWYGIRMVLRPQN